ncbi:MAG: single-stranded DNA-binding protein [Clostridia bacterium]|nr:single-stranded DNA-binding protein [Clostridia bacterium]NLF20535.1 single-stranded DNA-binding protein [Clostridiaceae bacterium]
MNKAILMGRLTQDPELKSTNNGISVCTFSIAVDRRFKNASGEREADFIPIVTWRQTAEFVAKYFHKGSRIALVGSIQVRSWQDKEGGKRYTTEVVADECYFADSKASGEQKATNYGTRSSGSNYSQKQSSSDNSQAFSNDGFFEAPDDDTALPFDL